VSGDSFSLPTIHGLCPQFETVERDTRSDGGTNLRVILENRSPMFGGGALVASLRTVVGLTIVNAWDHWNNQSAQVTGGVSCDGEDHA